MTMTGMLDLIERIEPQISVTVNLAYQTDLEREVIIKRLTPSAAADPRLRGRFAKEARMLAAMRHHNIVQVHEAGLHDPLPYVVMEQLSGITVQQRLDHLLGMRQRMDVREVAQVVRNVASAIEYAHQFGVIGHQLSLDNIVLSNDGRTVLASLARPLPDDLLSATPLELAFAAPERLFGGVVDARTDVYALGVLLYTLVAGRLPFEGSTAGILARKQDAASLPPLDDPRTQMSCAYTLVHLMRQATAHDASLRYPTVAAFREAFEVALHGPMPQLELRSRVPRGTLCRIQTRRLHRAIERELARRQGQAVPARRSPLARAEPVLVMDAAGDLLLERAAGQSLADVAPRRANARAATVAAQPIPTPAAPVALAPQMPGRDQPELHAALPYTILVPLTGSADADGASMVAVQASAGSTIALHLWIAAMLTLGALAVGAALMLG
jgi:hypothetical protein